MEKLFNNVCFITAFLGGIIIKLVGGWDTLISALIILMVFDYITGLLKSFFLKNLDSNIGFIGIVKKVIIIIIVSTSFILGNIIGSSLPLREIVITFFISNECISILENASFFIPIPNVIKEALNQLRMCENDGEENDKRMDNDIE